MITPPPLIDVSPGDPITSESWNNILNALRTAYDFLNEQQGTLTVQARNQADGNPIRGAVVTVTPTTDTTLPTRAGVFAGGAVNAHLVEPLLPGQYDLVVEADGFNTETRQITMPDTGEGLTVPVDMSVAEARFGMSNVFGLPLSQALALITQDGFTIARIIDSHGTDIPPGAIPSEVTTAFVLGQWPFAGDLVPLSTPVYLHVSAKAEFLDRVNAPDLRGLTLEDAKTLLEASGLTLGTTTTVEP
jgi:hypothetical protein